MLSTNRNSVWFNLLNANNPMIKAVKFLIFPLLLCSQCQPPHKMNSNLYEKLDAIFNPLASDGLSGGAIHIEKGGEILYAREFGFADFETKEKFTSATIANLGSISKTFVAYGILKLQEEGKLNIDDPLSKYFPDFENKKIADSITIRHFLTHTSGIPDTRKVDEEFEFYLTADDEENFAPLKATQALEFKPGTGWNYSNPAFNGLALIIEKVSGKKWQEYIREHIFLPSGMEKSTITDGAHPASGVAHAYEFRDGQPFEYDYGEYPTFCAAGNGGVWSSIEELRNYYSAIKENRFVSPATNALALTLWTPENWTSAEPPKNGFSWFVYEKSDSLPFKMIEHTGHQGGFAAIMTMIPEEHILVLMEFNTTRDVAELRGKVVKCLQESLKVTPF
jgi:CubicO group peptidase (beta-lactamase class C family)